jgi:hypothetical protein
VPYTIETQINIPVQVAAPTGDSSRKEELAMKKFISDPDLPQICTGYYYQYFLKGDPEGNTK